MYPAQLGVVGLPLSADFAVPLEGTVGRVPGWILQVTLVNHRECLASACSSTGLSTDVDKALAMATSSAEVSNTPDLGATTLVAAPHDAGAPAASIDEVAPLDAAKAGPALKLDNPSRLAEATSRQRLARERICPPKIPDDGGSVIA
jgi:hypothetical protein